MSSASPQQIPFNSYTPRVAIVTGGCQGIGNAIAHRLADDGFDVAVNDIASKQESINKTVEEIRKKGRKAIAVPGDVSSETDIISIIEKAVQELGGVDAMVANAGIAKPESLLDDPIDVFDKLIAVNARGVYLCFKYAAKQMVKQERGGRLIAASSVAGRQGLPNCAAYSASKFAVRGIMQSAAGELRKYGITANAYAPGPIRTPILQPFEEQGMKIDAGITGAPEDIGSIVSYIAKPESHFINGQTITVDGGNARYD